VFNTRRTRNSSTDDIGERYFLEAGLVRPPPPFDRTAIIFVTILGLFLAPFTDKIAASDQMRFLGRKMLQCIFAAWALPRSRWGSLQRSTSAANLFTVDSRRVVPAR